jgi:FlaA1/EpsC-like NDP-sugar epimerase
MIGQLKNVRFYIIIAADAVIFCVSLVVAYLLRFDFALDNYYHSYLLSIVSLIISTKLFCYFLFGLYKGMWRYTSITDLVRLGQACLFALVIYSSLCYFNFGFKGFPRSIFILDALLTFILTAGQRVGIRYIYSYQQNSGAIKNHSLVVQHKSPPPKKSILIVGAGRAGEITIREIFGNPQVKYRIAGFLDDDRTKWGRCLHGVKIYGGVALLPQILEQRQIDEVLIAIPSASGAQMRRIVEICEKCKVRFRTLPEIGAIISGKVSINSFREIKYEDLLRRAPVNLDTAEISRYLTDKVVLVTGAGGSIGSEICRQIAKFGVKRLVLLDAAEQNLFNIQMEMEHELNFPRCPGILSRVQNRPLMDAIFAEYRPHVVFHAAAYKHVPMLEKNPWEAIFNNVLGSQVAMEMSQKYAVESFVLVSTDKAVRPTNVMGASKRLTELILQSIDGVGTRFMAVRFGNVAGSSGSVLPLFQRQIEHGGPITVTHPEVTRYFMTIPEAAQLILQAGALGERSKIFILEMGTPIKIVQMAEELVKLSGKEPGKDIDIIFTGLRDGEKLYEELMYAQGESVVGTRYDKIMVLQSNGNWNGMKNQENFKRWLNRSLQELYRLADIYEARAIKHKLREILPEYTPHLEAQSILEDSSYDLDLVTSA